MLRIKTVIKINTKKSRENSDISELHYDIPIIVRLSENFTLYRGSEFFRYSARFRKFCDCIVEILKSAHSLKFTTVGKRHASMVRVCLKIQFLGEWFSKIHYFHHHFKYSTSPIWYTKTTGKRYIVYKIYMETRIWTKKNCEMLHVHAPSWFRRRRKILNNNLGK